jgi:hypothetical protein
MPKTNDGTGVGVGLLPDPFAHQFAYASQIGRFDFSDVNIDARYFLPDPNGNDGDTDYGINLILLNSVTRPLKLVDTQAAQIPSPTDPLQTYDCDSQVLYPSYVWDGVTLDHEIPAARPYPIQANHLRPDGSPALLAGIGHYRFDMVDSFQGYSSRVLSFSLGDTQTPLVGVHIQIVQQPRGVFRHNGSFASVAVTADLEREYATLDKFMNSTLPDPTGKLFNKPTFSTSAADRGALTVWCAPYVHDIDQLGTNSVVVWVRDVSSTTG